MYRIIRNLLNKKKLKNKFPNRIDSIKKLDNNDYTKISNDFNSYGSFVNFCISEKISVKSKQRRELLNKFYNKKE